MRTLFVDYDTLTSWFRSCSGRLHKFRNGIVPREEKDASILKSDEFLKKTTNDDEHSFGSDGLLSTLKVVGTEAC